VRSRSWPASADTIDSVDAASFDRRFIEIAADWAALGQPRAMPRSRAALRIPPTDSPRRRPMAEAQAAFEAAKAEVVTIRAAGRWVSGPGDLLSILGRQRDELFHSRILAWLMNPSGRHALGTRFLREFLAEVWPGEDFDTGGPVAIDVEVTRTGTSAESGHTVEARADLVLGLESLVVVVENKLDAGEQQDQCERLYWPWAGDPVETRWVFLTPTGRAPMSATSQVARDAWSTASYAHVHRALGRALDQIDDRPADTGRASALQYLATLNVRHDR
jgi:PAS domain-containing protein